MGVVVGGREERESDSNHSPALRCDCLSAELIVNVWGGNRIHNVNG